MVGLWPAPRPELTFTDCLDLRSTAAIRKRFPIAAFGHKLSFSGVARKQSAHTDLKQNVNRRANTGAPDLKDVRLDHRG